MSGSWWIVTTVGKTFQPESIVRRTRQRTVLRPERQHRRVQLSVWSASFCECGESSAVRGSVVWGGPYHGECVRFSNSNTSFAYAVGGGIDYHLIPLISWCVEGDLLQTRFFSSTQNNGRISTGVVIHFYRKLELGLVTE